MTARVKQPTMDEAETAAPAMSRRRLAWRRFLGARLALPGGIVILIFTLAAIFAPLVAPYDPYADDLAKILLPPNADNWFGTDELGRDILSRIIYGARLSMIEGLVSVAIAMAIGVPLGVLAGYYGGYLDATLMRILDVFLAFPGVVLAVVIIGTLGPGLVNAIIAVGIYSTPIFARVARASTLTVRQEPYIEACHATRMSDRRIITRHILLNIAPHLLVLATMRVAVAILIVSSLSFLNLGAQEPIPEWGAMLARGREFVLLAPHAIIFPGVAIILLVLALNLFQDGLRAAFDPAGSQR